MLGPFYLGLDITPAGFGGFAYEEYNALEITYSRWMFQGRLYAATLAPMFFLDFGLGVQFTSFKAADHWTEVYDDAGHLVDHVNTTRFAVELAVGMEAGWFSLQVGLTHFPNASQVTYTPDSRVAPVRTVGGPELHLPPLRLPPGLRLRQRPAVPARARVPRGLPRLVVR